MNKLRLTQKPIRGLWELIKRTVRNVTIKFATKKKGNKWIRNKPKIQNWYITKEIGEIRDEGRLEKIRNELQQMKNELESITWRELNGLILRSKANIIENNERNTKYFASLEKKRKDLKQSVYPDC